MKYSLYNLLQAFPPNTYNRESWNYYLDPSTTNTGIVLESTTTKKLLIFSLDFSKIKIDKDIDKSNHFNAKLKQIYPIFQQLIQEFPPSSIYMEGIFIQPKFFTSSSVLLKFHGFLSTIFINYPIYYHPPKQIKKRITGNGNASKEEVKDKLEEKYQIQFKNNDQSDAFAIWEYEWEEKNPGEKPEKIIELM